MSDEIKNAGKKGYFLLWLIFGFGMFLAVVLYIYFYNFKLTF